MVRKKQAKVARQEIQSGVSSRRKVITHIWVAPVVCGVSIPLHAQTSMTEGVSDDTPRLCADVLSLAPFIQKYVEGDNVWPNEMASDVPPGAVAFNVGAEITGASGSAMFSWELGVDNGGGNFLVVGCRSRAN